MDNDLNTYMDGVPEPAPETDVINDIDNELEDEVLETDIQGSEQVDVEPDLSTMPDSSGNKPDDGPGVVAKLLSKLGLREPEESEEEVGDPIPEEFLKAAESLGLTDEEIIEFADELTDEELIDSIPTLLGEVEEEEPKEVSAKQEGEPSPPLKTELEPDNLEAVKEAIRNEFRAELDDLKSKLAEVSETTEAKETADLVNYVNDAFDEASEKYEIFGKTENLLRYPAGPNKGQVVPTSPEMKARSEVFDKATAFINAGIGKKEAMEDALAWYKGKYLERDVHRNVIKDLKAQEQKLSAKRSAKETTKQYEDEDERRADVVRELARRANVKGELGG